MSKISFSLEQFIDLVEGPLKELYNGAGLPGFEPVRPTMVRHLDGTVRPFGPLGPQAQIEAFIRHEWPRLEPRLDEDPPIKVVEHIRDSFPLLARMTVELSADPSANLHNLSTKMAAWLDRELR